MREKHRGQAEVAKASTQEEKTGRFWERAADHQQSHDELAQDFKSKYLGEAVYLKGELLRRLGEQSASGFDPTLIAFGGMLAGPQPITDAANYLESLARRLEGRG